MDDVVDPDDWFDGFVGPAEQRLRRALVAGLGHDAGVEATNIALAYGWEHRQRLSTMENPVGYLYRVGRSRREAAEALEISVSSLDTHLARGLERLRAELGVGVDG